MQATQAEQFSARVRSTISCRARAVNAVLYFLGKFRFSFSWIGTKPRTLQLHIPPLPVRNNTNPCRQQQQSRNYYPRGTTNTGISKLFALRSKMRVPVVMVVPPTIRCRAMNAVVIILATMVITPMAVVPVATILTAMVMATTVAAMVMVITLTTMVMAIIQTFMVVVTSS